MGAITAYIVTVHKYRLKKVKIFTFALSRSYTTNVIGIIITNAP